MLRVPSAAPASLSSITRRRSQRSTTTPTTGEISTLGKAVLRHCHRFVIIPTRHCTNLSAAVYTTLYDRHAKRVRAGLEDPHRIAEPRGSFAEPDSFMDEVGVTWSS